MSKETEKLYKGITEIDEDMIEEAQDRYNSCKKPLRFIPWAGAAAAVCVCAAVGVFVLNGGLPSGDNIPVATAVSTSETSVTEVSTLETTASLPEIVTTSPTDTEPNETSISEQSPITADTTSESAPEETEPAIITVITEQTTSDTVTETVVPSSSVSETTKETTAETTAEITSETTPVTERKEPQTSVNELTYLAAPDDAAAVLTEPVYPYIPPYPDEDVYTDYDEYDAVYEAWENAKYKLRNQPEGYTNGTDSFFRNSIREILSDGGSENKVFSPLSMFMALGMSAEISGGYTRQQFLDVLGQDSIEDLRSHAKSIWEANYSDDGAAKCILASSVWLNNCINYAQETVGNISDCYYSSVYSGIPGTEEYDKMIQEWLNSQTDGMLSEQCSDVQLDPSMYIALASTVNYSGKWNEKFSKELTKKRSFRTPDGYIGCDFMNADKDMFVSYTDKFTAVSLSLEENGSMRLILPDKGINPEDLLSDSVAIEYMMLKNTFYFKNNKYLSVSLSVPKFDVSQQFDLTDGMKKLGITDAFDPNVSDFEPLTDDSTDISIGTATQAARVMIDEDGCKAAAFTLISYDADMAIETEEHIDLIYDRPFIFEIMSATGLPLFVGIVNNPTE